MNVKLRASVTRALEKLKTGTFDEDDIKMLLIDVRDLIRAKNLLYELATFVAHPTERLQGRFHRALQARHFKLKLQEEQMAKLLKDPLLHERSPPNDSSVIFY